MIENLFSPLFGFPGISARITGFVFRVFSITLGLILLILFIILALSVYPAVFFVFYKIATLYPFLTVPLIVLLFLIYAFYYIKYPVTNISKAKSDLQLKLATKDDLRSIIRDLIHNNISSSLNKLSKKKGFVSFFDHLELTSQESTKLLTDNLNNIINEKVFSNIRSLAKQIDIKHIDTELLVASFILSIPNVDKYFESKNRDHIEVIKCLKYLEYLKKKPSSIWSDEYKLNPGGGVDKGWASGYTAELNKYSTDFTKMAIKGLMPTLIGREDVKSQLIEILSKPSKNNAMLIGDPGCGKTTFIKGFAKEISTGTSIKALKYKRLVSLDIGALTSGGQGKLNERLTKILKEINDSGNVIIFVDEIHNLSSTLNADPNAVAAFSTLEPQLSSGKFQFIGATSKENYVKYIQPNESFSRNFDLVEMRDATVEESVDIIQAEIKDKWINKVMTITYPAIAKSAQYAGDYLATRVLPDSAVQLINQAIAKTKQSNQKILNSQKIAEIVSETSGVPVTSVTQTEKDKLVQLDQILHQRVIGQNQAITQIASAIKRSRVSVRDEKKPIASFMFAGPTGVGKTETAKALAFSYYGSESEMLRFDMSEYQEIQNIRRLIGSEDGEIGQLTSEIRSKPFSLVLLDEIEKAHPKILNIFLQVLDEGFLTDAAGRKISFSNTFIIMTTNVGALDIVNSISQNKPWEDVHSTVMSSLRNHFPPEFLNRFTGIVPFTPLNQDEISKIAILKLNKLAKSLYQKHKIQITFSNEVINYISQKGYSPEWGARFLNRVIEDKIETKIAEKILSDEYLSGQSVVFGLELINQNDL